jgi:hypothetical protein
METKMINTNTGGSAFPTPRYERGDMYSLGMTLRDYFAAKAMQGFLANNNIDAQQIAKAAYIVADAMLKAREE